MTAPTKINRRRYVEWATALTRATELAPTAYELWLLERYISEEISLTEVIFLTENYRLFCAH